MPRREADERSAARIGPIVVAFIVLFMLALGVAPLVAMRAVATFLSAIERAPM